MEDNLFVDVEEEMVSGEPAVHLLTFSPAPSRPWTGCDGRSVVSDSLRSHTVAGQAPLSLEFSKQEYQSE